MPMIMSHWKALTEVSSTMSFGTSSLFLGADGLLSVLAAIVEKCGCRPIISIIMKRRMVSENCRACFREAYDAIKCSYHDSPALYVRQEIIKRLCVWQALQPTECFHQQEMVCNTVTAQFGPLGTKVDIEGTNLVRWMWRTRWIDNWEYNWRTSWHWEDDEPVAAEYYQKIFAASTL